MTDVTLRNRILVMLIPSLEKSAAEAENLGKLAIACLRVMMSKNLGAEVEGDHEELLGSKATNSPYPYLVALDELAYYFSDGIAVMFAQARSLGTSMIAAAQDLEKLTEGSRAAEAGAMIANTTTKFFMRIDDTGKTAEMIQKVVGKAKVALKEDYRFNGYGYTRRSEINIREVDRVSTERLQAFKAGEGVVNAMGKTYFMKWFYMGGDIEKHRVKAYYINRFLQVAPPSRDAIVANSIAIDAFNDPHRKGKELIAILRQQTSLDVNVPFSAPLADLAEYAKNLSPHEPAEKRSILLYMKARALLTAQAEVAPLASSGGGRSSGGAQSHKQAPLVHGRDGFEGDIAAQDMNVLEDDLNHHVDGDDTLDDDPLSFLKTTPFERKPASEVLGGLDEEIEAASHSLNAEPEHALFADPIESMLLVGRSVGLAQESMFKGKALSVLVGAPEDRVDPSTGLPLEARDDWIGAAIQDACFMVSSPRSSDDTVIGFNEETMAMVVKVEQLMSSPNPSQAAKSFERVVATKVTPSTVPEELQVDASPDEMDAFFAQLGGGQVHPR
jgi:intracellular multiplication protein IcmO